MLQLSHQARLRARSGFICSSCRHILTQQKQQRQPTTTCSTLLSSPSAGVAVAASYHTITPSLVPGSPHSNYLRLSRPFSASSRRYEDDQEKNETTSSSSTPETAHDADAAPKEKAMIGGENENSQSSAAELAGHIGVAELKEAVTELERLLGQTPPDPAQLESAAKLVEKLLAQQQRPSLSSLPSHEPATAFAITTSATTDENTKKSEEVISGLGTEIEAQLVRIHEQYPNLDAQKSLAKEEEGEEVNKDPEDENKPKNNAQESRVKVKEKPRKKRGKASKSKKLANGVTPNSVSSSDLELRPIERKQPPVPRLSYGLDRVLFNPGVYHLQDPRTRVYNFDPYLAQVMPLKEFDFTALKQFITSSQDTKLIRMAAEHKRKYTGSTSSMTSMLSHFHYLLSAWRPLTLLTQSRHFEPSSRKFGKFPTSPSAAFLLYKDGVYAIDADKEFDTESILSKLGHTLEKLLTVPREEYEKYRKINSHMLSKEQRNSTDTYQYTTLGDFMLRSQLDAFDPRIPGTGTFDVKTRAVVPIRCLRDDVKLGFGYEIRNRFGQWESYEREYFDMIRNAFMKYSLQVRMGRMDGCFVAFHNTERIFGFQYIPLSEMDHAIHGTPNPNLGDQEFKLSIHLLNQVLDKATKRFPRRSLRLHVETRPTKPAFMYIFAEPVTDEQIAEVQDKHKRQVEEFERELAGIEKEIEKTDADSSELDDDIDDLDVEGEPYRAGEADMAAWEDMMERVEEALDDEEQGSTAIRETIRSALLQSRIIDASDSKESRRYLQRLVNALTSNAETQPVDPQGHGSPSLPDTELAGAGDAAASVDPENQEPGSEGEMDKREKESLKDLVLRLASQAKARYHQAQPLQDVKQAAEQNVSEDTLKLQNFMGILSGLVARNLATDGPTVEAAEVVEEQEKKEDDTPPKELMGMVLTVKNKINDEYVERPFGLNPKAKWEVEYVIEEIEAERAQKLYSQVKNRRRKMFIPPKDMGFQRKLMRFARRGRAFRHRESLLAGRLPVHVLPMGDKPFTRKSVFENTTSRPAASGKDGPSKPVKFRYRHVFPKGRDVEKWEDTKERHVWADLLRNIRQHIPQFENTSTYYEDHPGEDKQRAQLEMMRLKKLELEKNIAVVEAQLSSSSATAAAKRGKEAQRAEADALTKAKEDSVAVGEMLGLNLNDIPEKEEGEEKKQET